jgi:hypothetical protein
LLLDYFQIWKYNHYWNWRGGGQDRTYPASDSDADSHAGGGGGGHAGADRGANVGCAADDALPPHQHADRRRKTKVRGTLEREITLPQGTARINPREVAALPPEEQFFYFLSFISTLLYDFTAHQQRGSEGIVLYTKQRVYATPEEIMALSGQVEAILAPYLDPERGEQPWLFSGIVMPDAGGLEAQHKDET